MHFDLLVIESVQREGYAITAVNKTQNQFAVSFLQRMNVMEADHSLMTEAAAARETAQMEPMPGRCRCRGPGCSK